MLRSIPDIPLTQSDMGDFKGNHWPCHFKTLARRREEEKEGKALEACLDKEVQTGSLFPSPSEALAKGG